MCIYPIALECDPVRSEVPFLEHMDGQAAGSREFDGRTMERTLITEHDEIGVALPIKQFGIKRWQAFGSGSICALIAVVPIPAIARVEVHLGNVMLRGQQRLAEPAEKGRTDSLQQ